MKAEHGVMVKLFNKRLTQAIETHYDGTYELVGKEDLKDPKYADLNKYRYTVNAMELNRSTTTERRSFSNGGVSQSSSTSVTVDLFFTDRTTGNKLNKTGFESSSYITSLRDLGLYLSKYQKKG
jgi:hypothetical protein